MTARGFLALLTGSALLLSSLVTGSAALFWPGALVLLLFLMGACSALTGLLSLRVSQSCPPEVRRGDDCPLTLLFTLHALLPLQPLTLMLHTPGGKTEAYLLRCRCWGRTQAVLRLPCPHVGSARLGVEQMELTDCFGFFCLRRKVKRLCQTLVLPRPLESGSALQSPQSPMSSAALRAEGDMPEDCRAWREGDELKRIHWKLSARSRELMVRTQEREHSPDTLILLPGRLPESLDTRAQAALTDALCDRLSGTLRQAAVRQGRLLLLLPGGREIDLPLFQHTECDPLDRVLAETLPGTPETAAQLLGERFGSVRLPDTAVVFTAVLTASDAASIVRLSAMGIAVSLVLCLCEEPSPQLQALLNRVASSGISLRVAILNGKEASAA